MAPGNGLYVGSGADITIRELAGMIAKVTGYKNDIAFDESKPDGTPRKLMDSSRIQSLGWKARVNLEEGLKDAYKDFCLSSSKQITS